MVSPNSINILLLILICLLLRFSIGHSLKVKNRTVGTDLRLQAERRSVKADDEEMMEGVAAEMEERTRFGGRKMGSSKAMRSQRVDKASSTSSGGGQGCVKSKFRSGHNSVSVDMSGFVSWNADYNVPRPYLPRNNRPIQYSL